MSGPSSHGRQTTWSPSTLVFFLFRQKHNNNGLSSTEKNHTVRTSKTMTAHLPDAEYFAEGQVVARDLSEGPSQPPRNAAVSWVTHPNLYSPPVASQWEGRLRRKLRGGRAHGSRTFLGPEQSIVSPSACFPSTDSPPWQPEPPSPSQPRASPRHFDENFDYDSWATQGTRSTFVWTHVPRRGARASALWSSCTTIVKTPNLFPVASLSASDTVHL